MQERGVPSYPRPNYPNLDIQYNNRVGGGVSGWEGVPGHELLHEGEEQIEAHTWYKHQAKVLVYSYLV